MDKEQVKQKIKALVDKFERNKHYYLSKDYLEEQVKIDFINPFFEALGWDVRNVKGLSPYEREVLVEKGETTGRPDYNFRIDGQTKFFVEVKAPHEPLHKIDHILQAKSYAWNTKQVFVVLLTDFEEFRLFDASLKPNPKNPEQGIIFDFKYTDYLKNLDKLLLLSKEEVQKGSLDRLLLKDALSKKLRIPVDKSFLEDMSRWREELAKDIYKRNQPITVKMLNEVVQRILDRLIFIRIAEDRKIVEPKTLLEIVELWKAERKRKRLQSYLNILFRQLNEDFNGEILKPHACEIVEIDSHLLAKIIENLYFPQCIYKFDVIDVDLLGSIYERYLGKTIKVTPKRVKVEEKPEVRKAGGVYYTPKYIVDYIVKNTVGKIIQGKTPEQISKIKILDPACGSGSFLISAFQTLIDYHLHYYEKHPEESGQGTLFPDVIEDYDGTKRLSIEKKAQILRNNIFGVDIDPQAVEITMMSLYLKCLEGEKDLPRKKELLPSLAKNIRCGNSLISFDIFDQPTLFKDEEKERINPFDWYSKSTGFGDIMEQGGFDVVIGNPPYIRIHSLPKVDINYYRSHYVAADKQFDIFCIMIEKGISLLKQKGRLGFIVPSLFLKGYQYSTLRKLILEKTNIESLTDFGDGVFENVKMPTCVVIFQKIRRPNDKNKLIFKIKLPNEKGFIKKIVPQIIYKTTESHTFEDIDEKTYSILLKIKKRAIDLESIMRITRGLEIGKKNKGISSQKIKGFIRVLSGEDIGRYEIRNVKFLDKNLLKKFWKDKEIFENPKIMIRETGVQITATYDDTGIYTLRTIYNMILKDHRFNLKYILGLLNSRLMQYFYTVKFKPVTDIFPKIRVVQTRKLPIRTIDFNNPKERAMHDKIVKLVDKMLELNKKKNSLPPSSERERIEREIKITDEKIDELVYELYGIIEEERKIIERGG